MKTVLKVWGAMLLVAFVASLLVAGAVYLWGPPEYSQTLVHFDDTSITIGAPTNWLVAMFGVALALLIVATVVPLVVVLSLALAALGTAIGVTAAAIGLLIPLSPFLLIGWLIWRVVHKPKPAPAPPVGPGNHPPPAATIAA
jgi:hypothetical protein